MFSIEFVNNTFAQNYSECYESIKHDILIFIETEKDSLNYTKKHVIDFFVIETNNVQLIDAFIKESKLSASIFEIYIAAAKSGNVDMMNYAKNNGCIWTAKVCLWAAKNGHVQILEWVKKEKGIYDPSLAWEFRPNLYLFAACEGHINVLEWGINNGILIDSLIVAYAASRGKHHVINWCIKHDIEIPEIAYKRATEYDHIYTLEYMNSIQQPYDYDCVSEMAAFYGKVRALEWLDSHNYTYDINRCISLADSRGHQNIIDYLMQKNIMQ